MVVTRQLTFKISESDMQNLSQLASIKGIGKATLARLAVRQYLSESNDEVQEETVRS